MAAHTVSYIAPELTVIGTVATDDTIENTTLGALEIVEGTVTGGYTSAGTAVTVIKPGETYTVLVGQNGKTLYSVNSRESVSGTVPTISVATA